MEGSRIALPALSMQLDLSQLHTSQYKPHLKRIFWDNVAARNPTNIIPCSYGFAIEYDGSGFFLSFVAAMNCRPLLRVATDRLSVEKIFHFLDEATQ
jgi:hypothetical protein